MLDNPSLALMEWRTHLLVVSKYYQLASCVILLYDYLLTFNLEVRRVWEHRHLTNLLFYLNRYFPPLAYIWILIAYHQTTWSSSACRTFSHFPLVMNAISDSVICAIVILRLYALYSLHCRIVKRCLLAILGVLAFVQVALDCWAAVSVTLLDAPSHSGCVITVKDDDYHVFGLLWATSVLFDSIACFLTVWKSMQNWAFGKGIRMPTADLLIRDGIIYFVVMFVAKVVNFVVFWTVSKELITINWTFNHTITVIMISRLFLNMRGPIR